MNILIYVPRTNWTQTQRSMMAKVGRYFSVRALASVATLVILAALAVESYGRFRAAQLVQSLARVELTKVDTVLDDIVFFRRWTLPRIESAGHGDPDDGPASVLVHTRTIPLCRTAQASCEEVTPRGLRTCRTRVR